MILQLRIANIGLPHLEPVCSQLLTINGGDILRQVGPHSGPSPLHEQFTIGTPVAGHQVIILSRSGPRRRRRKPKKSMVLQMLMGHCGRREREEEGEQGGREVG